MIDSFSELCKAWVLGFVVGLLTIGFVILAVGIGLWITG